MNLEMGRKITKSDISWESEVQDIWQPNLSTVDEPWSVGEGTNERMTISSQNSGIVQYIDPYIVLNPNESQHNYLKFNKNQPLSELSNTTRQDNSIILCPNTFNNLDKKEHSLIKSSVVFNTSLENEPKRKLSYTRNNTRNSVEYISIRKKIINTKNLFESQLSSYKSKRSLERDYITPTIRNSPKKISLTNKNYLQANISGNDFNQKKNKLQDLRFSQQNLTDRYIKYSINSSNNILPSTKTSSILISSPSFSKKIIKNSSPENRLSYTSNFSLHKTSVSFGDMNFGEKKTPRIYSKLVREKNNLSSHLPPKGLITLKKNFVSRKINSSLSTCNLDTKIKNKKSEMNFKFENFPELQKDYEIVSIKRELKDSSQKIKNLFKKYNYSYK